MDYDVLVTEHSCIFAWFVLLPTSSTEEGGGF